MPPDVDAYLADLVARATAVLGPDLVGAYAAGSLALDAFQPGRSDVDVALVVTHPLTRPAQEDLVAALRHEALPVPARGLELVAYPAATAGRGSADPGFVLELNTGPGMAFRATFRPEDRPPEDGTFWYALDRSILSASDRSLLGPSARTVFEDVSREDLGRLLVEALTWWLAVPGDPVDAVLGACRSLVRWREGRWLAKATAAERLLTAGGGAKDVLAAALAARAGRGAPPDREAAQAFQRSVRDEIARSR